MPRTIPACLPAPLMISSYGFRMNQIRKLPCFTLSRASKQNEIGITAISTANPGSEIKSVTLHGILKDAGLEEQ
jgi:hypothetical protein